MTTREEFEELVRDVVRTGENLHWNERIDAEDEYTASARDADAGAWSALLAVYDTQAARIAELWAQRNALLEATKTLCDAVAEQSALLAIEGALVVEYRAARAAIAKTRGEG